MIEERAEVLSRRRVFEGRLLKVDEEEIRLPRGKSAVLETIRHPGAAAVVPFVDQETVLLIRQYRHAAGGFIVEVPAGKLDQGEGPEPCALREIEEETGYRAGRLIPLGSILTTPGFTDEVIWLYEAHDLRAGKQNLGPDEVLELLPTGLAEAVGWIGTGKIRDGKTVAALLLAWTRRQGA